MALSENSLGGRLALLKPDDLKSDQKKLYNQLEDTMVTWAKKSGFQADTAADQLIGPFNAMLRSPLISKALMEVTATEGKETSHPHRGLGVAGGLRAVCPHGRGPAGGLR
jgi:4-carboxymuconolactone decarboxylase